MTRDAITDWPLARLAREPLAEGLRLGAVHLTVSDLERSLSWWRDAVGLRPRPFEGRSAGLHAGGEDLVVLVEEPGARPVRGHTGLFHLALLLPSRADLARWLAHAAAERVPLEGLSDHWVSEAIYLRDPDGHGLEIYADRPPDAGAWTRGMTTIPLDVEGLLATIGGRSALGASYEGMPVGTRVGHVHLHVADLDASDRFALEVLGLDRTTMIGGQASFWSADGYHHHLAGNLWAGRGATPPPPGSAALRHATLVLPSAEQVERIAARAADAGGNPEGREDGVLVTDPAGSRLLLAS